MNLALAARASAIDSAAPGQPSPVKIDGRIGKYTTLKLNGTVQPFAAQPTTDLRLELKDFSLPDVSAYPERFIGYKVQSGILDLHADVRIRQGQLDTKATLKLVKLDLKPLTSEEKSAATQELGFPLNAGLSMLRDRHGVIQLTFPVTGDLQNPHIGLSGIIRKAFLKGVRSTVLGYFSPLGAVATLGGKLLFHRIFHLRFKPVEFSPGQAQLSPQGRKYLQETAKRLGHRPSVTLTVCGVAVPADLQALPAPKDTGGQHQSTDVQKAKQQELGKALDLARRRSAAVQDALIGLGIDQDRLAVCAPEMDDSPQAVPRVELGI